MSKRRIFSIVLAIVVLITTVVPMSAAAEETEKTMYNIVVFVRFKDEPEFINKTCSVSGKNVSYREIIENTYNESSYSMQSYYRALSNEKLNLNTIYLFAKDENGNPSSFELEHTRGYYSPSTDKNGKNTEGYIPSQFNERRRAWNDDWGYKVNDALKNGSKFSTWNGQELNIKAEDLDYDNNNWMDSINVIFPKSTVESGYSASQSDVLWALQDKSARIELEKSNGETLYSYNYSQTGVEFDGNSVYLDDQKRPFITPSTVIHETGHVLGFNDLYYMRETTDPNTRPVYFMSPMAKQLSPVIQFMTSYEREAKGWLNSSNITEIKESGDYELEPVRDTKQTGRVAYRIKVPNKSNLWLYLEYRYTGSPDVNRFNASNPLIYKLNGTDGNIGSSRPSKTGVLMYLVNGANKFPSNFDGDKDGIWDMEMLGANQSTKSDAPRGTSDPVLEYGGVKLKVNYTGADKAKFTISGLAEAGNKVATPEFSVQGGVYSSNQSVSLNCSTPGAVIRYTLNGTEPTEDSTEFKSGAPIEVSKDTTIKAKAFLAGKEASNTATATYTINMQKLYSVQGRITDNGNGAGISGAELTLKKTGSGDSGYTVQSDNKGDYRFDNISNGAYTLSAEAAGYGAGSIQLTVSGGNVTDGNIKLSRIYNLDSIVMPAEIKNIANGTSLSDIQLPQSVGIVTQPAGAINRAEVIWYRDSATPSYDAKDKGAQTFTVPGKITLPNGVSNENSKGLNTSIVVSVLAENTALQPGGGSSGGGGGGASAGGGGGGGGGGADASDDGVVATPGTNVEAAVAKQNVFANQSRLDITGNTRVETSMKLADKTKQALGVNKFSTLIVVDGSSFPDGLTSSQLSVQYRAPVLLVTPATESSVRGYINSNLSKGGKVIMAGGRGAVSASFESQLKSQGSSVGEAVRFGGSDRYETNLKLLEEAVNNGGGTDELLIASGSDFADALSASATGKGIMIVGQSISPQQKAFLAKNKFSNMTILGGTGAVNATVEAQLASILGKNPSRIGGKDRVETSKMISARYFSGSDCIVYAKGDVFADGLAGGLLANTLGAPMRLSLSPSDRNSAAKEVKLGGIK